MHYVDTDISCSNCNFQETDRKEQRKIKHNKMNTNVYEHFYVKF